MFQPAAWSSCPADLDMHNRRSIIDWSFNNLAVTLYQYSHDAVIIPVAREGSKRCLTPLPAVVTSVLRSTACLSADDVGDFSGLDDRVDH